MYKELNIFDYKNHYFLVEIYQESMISFNATNEIIQVVFNFQFSINDIFNLGGGLYFKKSICFIVVGNSSYP